MFTGETYSSLQYAFRVSNNAISGIVSETCKVLYEVFADEYMPLPTTHDEWREIAEGFSKRWNWHNCVGAIDGKHIAIKKPAHSGTMYYNYKGFFSMVLMAVVDSSYKFIYVHVGDYGR